MNNAQLLGTILIVCGVINFVFFDYFMAMANKQVEHSEYQKRLYLALNEWNSKYGRYFWGIGMATIGIVLVVTDLFLR